MHHLPRDGISQKQSISKHNTFMTLHFSGRLKPQLYHFFLSNAFYSFSSGEYMTNIGQVDNLLITPVAKLLMLPLSEPASSLFTRLSCLCSKVSRFRHHVINLQTYLLIGTLSSSLPPPPLSLSLSPCFFLFVCLYPHSLFLAILWRSQMAKCQIFQILALCQACVENVEMFNYPEHLDRILWSKLHSVHFSISILLFLWPVHYFSLSLITSFNLQVNFGYSDKFGPCVKSFFLSDLL